MAWEGYSEPKFRQEVAWEGYLERKLRQEAEDKLGLKVCVWKLTTLMLYKKEIIMHISSPKMPYELFKLAKDLKCDITLDKLIVLPSERERWTEIFETMPSSNVLIHLVWKYIFLSRKGSAPSLKKSILDNCFSLARRSIFKLLEEQPIKDDMKLQRRMFEHLIDNITQENILKKNPTANEIIDYELEIAEKNSQISSLQRRLNASKTDVVQRRIEVREQNEAFGKIIEKLSNIHIDDKTQKIAKDKLGEKVWQAALNEVEEHLEIINDLKAKYEDEKDKREKLEEIISDLKQKEKIYKIELEERHKLINRYDNSLREMLREQAELMEAHKKEMQEHKETMKQLKQLPPKAVNSGSPNNPRKFPTEHELPQIPPKALKIYSKLLLWSVVSSIYVLYIQVFATDLYAIHQIRWLF